MLSPYYPYYFYILWKLTIFPQVSDKENAFLKSSASFFLYDSETEVNDMKFDILMKISFR